MKSKKMIVIAVALVLVVSLGFLLVPTKDSSVKVLYADVNDGTKEKIADFATSFDLQDEIDSVLTSINDLNVMSNNELFSDPQFIDYINEKFTNLNDYVADKSKEFADYTVEQKDLFVENVKYQLSVIQGYIDYLTENFNDIVITSFQENYDKFKESDYFPETNLILDGMGN